MGDAVVVIARTSGPGAFQLTDRVGVVRPAHCTALGKMILASLSKAQLERFVARAEFKPSTEKSITEIPTLMREIDEVRASGIAFDDGEFKSGGPLRRGRREGLHRRDHRGARHLRPDLAHDHSGDADAREKPASRRRPAFTRARVLVQRRPSATISVPPARFLPLTRHDLIRNILQQ